MIRLSFAAAVLAALVLPTLAAAKEPSQAAISGPGFSKTLKMSSGEFTATPIGRLTTAAGFFPSAVGQSPDPMLQARPAGPLGPRYTLVWTVPAETTSRVRQDLYPYARGGSVAYMRPGQPIYGARTTGGWYRGGAELKAALTSLGLPAHAPKASSGPNYALLLGLGFLGVLAAAGIAALLRHRRAPASARPEVALD
jgi:hypothetical protein